MSFSKEQFITIISRRFNILAVVYMLNRTKILECGPIQPNLMRKRNYLCFDGEFI